MPTMSDKTYRRRLIARVEALRTEAAMPMLRFHQQIGPVAARRWARFVAAEGALVASVDRSGRILHGDHPEPSRLT
jgi:hypothetical protein